MFLIGWMRRQKSIYYTSGGPWFDNYRNHPFGKIWLIIGTSIVYMPPHDLPGAPTMSASSPRFDQFDLRQMFASVRSLAVVGNAATILDYENGALIDNYDMVVRFNRAQVTGVEHKIGRRTDLLVANETNSLALAPSPADTLAPRCVLSFVLRGPDFDITPFRTWVGDHTPCLCLVPPDISASAAGPNAPAQPWHLCHLPADTDFAA